MYKQKTIRKTPDAETRDLMRTYNLTESGMKGLKKIIESRLEYYRRAKRPFIPPTDWHESGIGKDLF